MTQQATVFAANTAVSPELQHEVEQLLYHEARLLDTRQYRDWYAMLADDLHYWMPVRRNMTQRASGRATAAPGEASNFDDDKQGINWRLKRIETGMAWTEDPPSRTRHLITNVWVRPAEGNEYEVQSYFLVYRNRDETTTDIMAGQRDDVWRKTDDGWQLARRTVLLDQNVLLTGALSFFI